MSGSVTIKGEIHYKSNIGVYKSVLKRGKTVANITPEELPNNVPVKQLKLIDVDNLLKKHFGVDWRNNPETDLSFYRNLIDTFHEENINENENPDEEEILYPEDDGLRI